MAVTTAVKNTFNLMLGHVNLRLDTLTAEKIEGERIEILKAAGHLAEPAFPLLPGMSEFAAENLIEYHHMFRHDLESLMQGRCTPGLYDPGNSFFRTPDAEVLYLMVRGLRPSRVLEVGSGNSTRIVRQAINDGEIPVAEHVAIDPAPRVGIQDMVDRVRLESFEHCDESGEIAKLGRGDILFIDSSHMVRVGNDVVKLFCNVIPSLASGVIVHVHDVFLPFDYPEPFWSNYSAWGEQYLLQVLLQSGGYKILWPGYYVQCCRADLTRQLDFLSKGRAQSFWFEVEG